MIENVDLEIFESLVDKHLPKNERKMIIFYVYCFYCLLFTVFLAETKRQEIMKAQKEMTNWLEKELECPVCLMVTDPPKKIFQCTNSHLICDGCKNHLKIRSCLVCCVVTSRFTRNIPMERLIRSQMEYRK